MVQYGSMRNLPYGTAFKLASHPLDHSGLIGVSIEYTRTVEGVFVCSYLLRLKQVGADSVVLSEELWHGDSDCGSEADMYVDVAHGNTISVTIRDCVHGQVLAESGPTLSRS